MLLQGDNQQWDVHTHLTGKVLKKNITFLPDQVNLAQLLNPETWRNHYQPFACVFADEKTKDIVLVRDHLGLQPLYYYYQSGKCIFGETLPEVLKYLPSTSKLNERELANLFSDVNAYSDETLYQGIYRVEPGHIIHINAQGKITKKAFWQLEREGKLLHYKTDNEYVEHFSELMDEAMMNATQGHTSIGAEFSAGMDSSAVYCAAFKQGLRPELFMHAALPGTEAAERYDTQYETYFITHFDINNLTRVDAEGFDPLAIFQRYAQLFAGAPPYIFYMFANNIHQAVAAKGCKILLSGFGGDQGVSGHAPLHHALPSLIKTQGYRKAQQAILENHPLGKSIHGLKQLLTLAKYSHPLLHRILQEAAKQYTQLKKCFSKNTKPFAMHSYFSQYYKTPREAEWDFLQGPSSHEIRMRIEYSAIATKALGFEYRYPLLYPKLLEFYLKIPPEQKRQHGIGRLLMRRYLARQLPTNIFDSYKKRDGLDILPATMSLFEKKFAEGEYQKAFSQLPYKHLLKGNHDLHKKNNSILAYMLKYYSLNSIETC